MLTQTDFDRFAARGCNRVPLAREVLADLETPLSTYLKLASRPFSYLLESVQGGEKWGRYSIIGLPCRRRLEVRGKILRVIDNAGDGDHVVSEVVSDDPLDEVRRHHRERRVPAAADLPAGMPRFTGGLVGFFGYGTVRYIEPRIADPAAADPLHAPDILLLVSDEVVVFDNLSGRLFVIVHADPADADGYARGEARLDTLIKDLAGDLPLTDTVTAGDQPLPTAGSPLTTADTAVTAADLPLTTDDTDTAAAGTDTDTEPFSNIPRAEFESAVERCRKYIYDGDVFQVVISRRMSLPFTAAPLDLYRALRTLNPSPYMYYLNLRDYHIAGASPEILVRLEDGEVTLRPIAGTRPRGRDKDEDAALAAELLADPKECAEHLMLIDLGRNDVGRVARVGTVKVSDKMTVEKYSHVMHIASNVSGVIKKNLDAIDVLRAAFPAGTLTGAPKVRAMEIINEIEPDRRGIYAGAVGYLGWNGNLDTAIAIRTALIKDARVHIQAGAGIVADSVPANEWDETASKGRAVVKAVALAKRGLQLGRSGDGDDDDGVSHRDHAVTRGNKP